MVNERNKNGGSGRHEKDHLCIDSRTTGQGWAFVSLGFFLSVSFPWIRGLPISLGELNWSRLVWFFLFSGRSFLIVIIVSSYCYSLNLTF